MRDEIKRISKLVAEGKLTPEDAADLIDAFYMNEERESQASSASAEANAPRTEGSGEAEDPSEKKAGALTEDDNPFKSLIDAIEKIGKDASDSVNWKEVAETAKTSANKGFELLKSGIEDFSKGKFNVGWFGNQAAREVRLPLSAKEGDLLKIENGSGGIRVRRDVTESYVLAKGVFRGSTQEEAKAKADAFTLMVEESEHGVIIKQPSVPGVALEIEVGLSVTMAVEAKADHGDVKIEDTGARAKVRAKTGKIVLAGLNGPIEIDSDTGEVYLSRSEGPSIAIENKAGIVELKQVKGNINLRSASGAVVLSECSGRTIAVEAVSGAVSVDLNEPVSGTVSIRTVSGDASLKIVDGCDARITLTTLRGSAMSLVNLEDEAKTEQRVTGKLGSGSGSIDVSAVTGNVSLSERSAL